MTSLGGGACLLTTHAASLLNESIIKYNIKHVLHQFAIYPSSKAFDNSTYLSIELVWRYNSDNVASFRVDVEHIGRRFIRLLSHDDVAQHSIVRIGIICIVSRHSHHCSACQKQLEKPWVIMETNGLRCFTLWYQVSLRFYLYTNTTCIAIFH